MTTVRVFGRVMYPQSNLPYAGAHVVFMLDRGSWTADNRNYLVDRCIAYTDSNGDFAIDLWANREGSIPTKWICTMPDGDRFEFILLASMTQIALSQLRQANQTWENTPSPSPSQTSTQIAEKRQILSPNQNIWTLSESATNPGLSQFFVNGQKQQYAIDYQINGLIVTWLGYALKSNWAIELYYI